LLPILEFLEIDHSLKHAYLEAYKRRIHTDRIHTMEGGMMKPFFSQLLEKRFSTFEKRLKLGRRSGTDRRSVQSRRTADSQPYLTNGGPERRTGIQRRQTMERRTRWMPTTYWKSLMFR
jgi:hypothetical protein